MRKLLIGIVSLGVVLGVYLFYSSLSSTPMIEPDTGADLLGAGDGNVAALEDAMGKIGDTGLGPVRKAKYITLNKTTKQVEREFGFERLLHEGRDVWEIEKPYVNVYRRNLTCYITADKGEVQVETAVGKTTPRDATFSSNVVIHIVPKGDSSVKESFVYLDDIVFLSDRSLISTAGPVKFVSEDAQMQGTGLDLIYDDQRERLEYFKITDLDSLRIKTTQAAVLSGGSAAKAGMPGGDQAAIPDPNATPVAGGPEGPQTPPPAAPPTAAPPPDPQKQDVFYKCIVNRNVLVDAPDQMIFADEKLYLSDILWSKNSVDQSEEPNAGSGGGAQPAPAVVEQQSPSTEAASEPDIAVAEPPAEPNEPNVPSEQAAFITVTCDGGLIIVPADSTRDINDLTGTGGATASDSKRLELLETDGGRTKFFAQTIDYNAITEDVVAGGLTELVYYTGAAGPGEANEPPAPLRVRARKGAKYFKASNQAILEDCLCRMPQTGLSQPRDVTFTSPEITVNIPADQSKQPDLLAAGPTRLVFYTEDANAPASAAGPIPVTVTARRQARYSGDTNQMLFEGDCRSTMLREDPNVLIEYVLLSDRLIVDLSRDANTASAGLAGGVKHLTASGRVVNLAATKTAKAGGAFAQDGAAKLLGAVELKCRQFDFDAVEQFFLATGPGLIKLINSAPAEPNQQAGRLSLRKPCVAVIDGFETLKYLIAENRIIADAGDRKMLVNYFSTVDGKPEHTRAEASRVNIVLQQTPLGQTDLATLAATGGIYYEDTNNRFIGSKLFYDHKAGIVTVSGDESQPCYYNGFMVDGIKLDLNTDKVEANVVAPGALQTNR